MPTPNTTASIGDINLISLLQESGLTAQQIADAIKNSANVLSNSGIININSVIGTTFTEKLYNASLLFNIPDYLGKTLYIPRGVHDLDATQNITFINSGLKIIGDGTYQTIINIVYSDNNQNAINITKGNTPIYNIEIKDISLIATVNGFTNCCNLNTEDAGEVIFNHVKNVNDNPTGIAFRIGGREQYTFIKLFVRAPRPFIFTPNKNTTNGFVSLDHFCFIDGFFHTITNGIIFEVLDGVEISGFKIMGQPAFIGGVNIFKYNATTTVQNSYSIHHEGGRWEQHDNTASTFAYNITTPQYNEVKMITIKNFYNTSGAIINANGAQNISIEDCVNVGSFPFAVLNNVRNFNHKNVLTTVNVAPTLTNMREIFAVLDSDNTLVPAEAKYTTKFMDGSINNRPIRINGAELQLIQKLLTNTSSHYLNIRNDQAGVKFCKLDISIVSTDNTIVDNAVFMITPSTTIGTYGILKISGGTSFSTTNITGKFCVYNSSDAIAMSSPTLYNRLGIDCYIHCTINSYTI